jgi:uncharacterized protein involved in oxidation of intracellular sulfur
MAKHYLFALNEGPYGNERSYNGFRMASAVLKRSPETVRVFLMGDAASCAVIGQDTPAGVYNIERMLKLLIARGAVAV